MGLLFLTMSGVFTPTIALSDEAISGNRSSNQGELSSLFSSLADVKSRDDAEDIISKIWTLWSDDTTDDQDRELMYRGMHFMQTGNLSLAETIFSRILERDPDYMEAWNKRATVRYMQSNLDGSEADIMEVLNREPRHFGALAGLGMIKLQRGDYQDALMIYEDILIINPHSPDALRLIPELQILLRGDPA